MPFCLVAAGSLCHCLTTFHELLFAVDANVNNSHDHFTYAFQGIPATFEKAEG
jgi:hypothetical protein